MTNRPVHLSYRHYAGYSKKDKQPKHKKRKLSMLFKVIFFVLLITIIFAIPTYAKFHTKAPAKPSNTKTSSVTLSQNSKSTTPIVKTQVTACSNNGVSRIMIASISQQHLWVCDYSQVVYQTAVVTGDMNVIADVTPVGTYNIYAKETNIHLIGSDSRGSWNDFVYYWMPFLDNQYGVFGLHDATWRTPGDFGTISPYSDNASHGCIELPLAAAKWIFNWSSIGTPVTIES